VLDTVWETDEGSVRVTDFMPPRGEAADVVRIVEGLSGTVRMRSELVLRFDYGRTMPWVRRRGEDLEAVAGPDAVWLRTPAPTDGQDGRTVSEFTVRAGEQVPFVLTYRQSHLPRPAPVDPVRALQDTCRFWADWIGPRRVGGGARRAAPGARGRDRRRGECLGPAASAPGLPRGSLAGARQRTVGGARAAAAPRSRAARWRDPSIGGVPSARRSTPRSARRGSTPTAAPSRSTTGPGAWTPRCC
jgi:hypothetical protein